MDVKTKFKEIADSLGWGFEYARRDYQNLIDATDFIADTLKGYGVGETILFMDPVRRSNGTDGIDEVGFMMVLTKSNQDETYDKRVELYIDPVKDIIHGSFYNKLKCSFDINDWRSVEIINQFDWNADGLGINYSTKGY